MRLEFGSQNAAAIPAHLSRYRPRASARIALRTTPAYLGRTCLAFANPSADGNQIRPASTSGAHNAHPKSDHYCKRNQVILHFFYCTNTPTTAPVIRHASDALFISSCLQKNILIERIVILYPSRSPGGRDGGARAVCLGLSHAEQNALDWPGGKALPAALYSRMRRPATTPPTGRDHALCLRTQGKTHYVLTRTTPITCKTHQPPHRS